MSELGGRLEPYLLLAKSARGAAAAKVVSDAVSATGVYVFSELLDLPSIQELANVDEGRPLALLQLFAYGTWTDYQGHRASYPPLSAVQESKLKHLTLVTLASRNRSLPYSDLLGALELPSERALEDLIIDAIYAGLIGGKMYHHEKVLHVDWVAGRDVRQDDLATLQASLQNWSTTAANLLQALDDEIRETQHASATASAELESYKQQRDDRYAWVLAEEAKQRNAEASVRGPGNAYSTGGPGRSFQPDARPRRGEGGPSGIKAGGGGGSGILGRLRSTGSVGDDPRSTKRLRDGE